MIKEKDLVIIKCLRKNSRLQLKEISKKTGIPIPTVFERMKKINKFILKNTSLINYDQINFPIMVLFGLNTGDKNKDEIIKYLFCHKNVNNLFRTSGKFNLLIEGIFVNLKESNEFYDNLKMFFPLKINEFQIIDELKKEEFYV